CGEIIIGDYLSKVAVKTDAVYYGKGEIENIPTTGKFWIATDYNIRTAGALEAVKATDADIVFGDLKIAVDRATLNAPETYQIALRVIYHEDAEAADVEVFVDGKIEKKYENVTLADNVTLGSLDTTDVRFNYTKVVEVGDTATDAEYNDTVNKALRPCHHTVYDGLVNNAVRDESGKVTYTDKCENCGEIVYGISATDHHDEAASKLTYTNGKLSLSRDDMRYYIPTALIGADKDAYQVSFKFTLDEVADASKLFNNNNGRNILQYRGSNNSILRLYPISDGEDGYLKDIVDIGSLVSINKSSEKFMRIKVGETVDVSIIVNPSDKTADIYINGEFMMRREGDTDAVRSEIDFLYVGNSNYKATLSDIFILQSNDPHIHSDKWLTYAEKAATSLVINDDYTLSYEYDCYCGERASKGIESVVADGIAPKYGLTDSFVAVAAPEFEGEAVFAGLLMAKALPAEGTKALVSVGINAVLSVDNTGLLYVNGTASETTLTVGEYLGFAVVLSADGYSVYFDGEYLGEGELDGLGDISVGSEGMGKFHFEAIALVTLSADANEKYSVVTDSHAHRFDPYTAELIFNAEKTTINVEYLCTVCDKPTVDGITKDLYDNETTDEIEAIPAVIGTPVGGAVIINKVGTYTADTDTYWFSADFKVKEFSNKNRQPIVSLGTNGIVLIDADGTLRLANETATAIGSVKKAGAFNVTFSVQKGETALIHVYLDGKYCGTLEQTLDGTESIKVGTGSTGSLEVTNIKLCEIGNGGVRAIGAFSCQFHTFDASKAVINYLDLHTFSVKNRCLVCGHTITERPAYNNYVGATMPIYDAHGNIELPLNEADFGSELDAAYHGHWIVVDVNQRSGWFDIGNFYGFRNLIGSKGNSLVLIDQRGKLMLGNGKALDTQYCFESGKTTKNFALEYVFADTDNNPETDDGNINVYIDGKYVSSFAVAEIKHKYEHTSVSYEEFGAAELENIKFYNIRSFVTCDEGEFITFEYAEDESVVPCAHVYEEYSVTKTAVFGEKIQMVYICNKCGERVHKVYDESLYDTSLNSKFVFDENGELTISNTTDLVSSPDIIGSKGEKYWLKFKLNVKELNIDIVSADDNNNGKGRILLNFNTNNNSPLRLFGVYDYKTRQYRSDCLSIRENAYSNASEIVRIYEGKSYEFALFVDPVQRSVEIYLNGIYITTRYNATYANGMNIRFLDGNWGTFTISDFSFVTGDELKHTHTAKYSEALGVTPSLEYSNETLKHIYICNCGKEVAEGIDEIYANEIEHMESIVSATRISEAANSRIVNKSYWVSAKVYGDGSAATVYSYNGTELVGISDGKYTVGGTATDIPVSHTVTPGDYDLISMNVIPAEDTAVVYINGFVAGQVSSVDFAEIENFNILLGGGATLDFKFIKVVSLADGATGKVTVAGCGDHELGYRAGVMAAATDSGVDYVCKYCNAVMRTISVGEGGIIEHTDTIPLDAQFMDLIENENFYEDILKNTNGESIWMTFNAKPIALSEHSTSDNGVTLLKFQIGEGNDAIHRIMLRAFKVDDNTIKITCQNSAGNNIELSGSPILVSGNMYSFVIEYNTSTNEYHIYLNGRYLGGSSFRIAYGENDKYKLCFGGSGNWELSNFKIFDPTIDENKEVEVKVEEVTYPHTHFPDTSKKQPISVDNGIITQSFTCVCGKPIELSVMKNVVEGNQNSNFSKLYYDAKYDVYNKINSGTGTYVLSYDFTVHNVNVSEIAKNGDDGTAFVFLYDPNSRKNIELLYAYPHKYEEKSQYTDRNGDGYADGVIDLRSKSGIDSGNPVLATLEVDDSVNITYVIDPNVRRIAVYVNDEYKHLRESSGTFYNATQAYVRIKVSGYGQFSYDNFKLVRMSDECDHIAPVCAEGVYSVECERCQKTVAPTHSYKTEYDRRHMWTKYTCETCGAFHIEFNRTSQLGRYNFINENEFMKYLSDTYCPVFKEAE
ncbi:MAG: hypothetical protein IJW79_01475, partial [Clostridia bacterium]|nr:hypothetical protein [Clostridia bacterium]